MDFVRGTCRTPASSAGTFSDEWGSKTRVMATKREGGTHSFILNGPATFR